MAGNEKCPVCDYGRATEVGTDDHGNVSVFDCPRCGRFRIGGMAAYQVKAGGFPKMRLSAWIRQHRECNRQSPEILQHTLPMIVGALPDYRVSEKPRLLLEAVERRTVVGETTRLVLTEDFPVAWAENEKELGYLLTALEARGFINLKMGPKDALCEITLDGWEYLDEAAAKRTKRKQVFVAMWFDKKMDDAWRDGIKPALEEAGYRPCRIDEVPHLERIDAKIQAEIKDSQFVVADVTGQRPGVYFEAGYAMGLGLDVVWTVRKDDLDNVHFDTRQFNHIPWENPDDLRQKLTDRIVAVSGRAE